MVLIEAVVNNRPCGGDLGTGHHDPSSNCNGVYPF